MTSADLARVRDRGRTRVTHVDVDANVSAIWTVKDGLVFRAEFNAERQQAFDLGGVSLGAAHGHDAAS
jgi:hypothetical protein